MIRAFLRVNKYKKKIKITGKRSKNENKNNLKKENARAMALHICSL